jgi:hypothetical protein
MCKAQRKDPVLRLSATEQLRRGPPAAHPASRSFQASRTESRVEQLGNHIGGIVIRHAWWQKGGDFAEVISGSDQAGFNIVTGAYLRMSDVRYQRVAKAYSATVSSISPPLERYMLTGCAAQR